VNLLCSRADDELPPACLAARSVVRDCVRELAESGRWQGVTIVTGG
jgi:LysR family tcuABC transcriptional regulator